MIIDAHNHPDWHGHDLDKFLANMAQCHIDLTWLLSWECPFDEYNPVAIASIPDTGPSGPMPFARCRAYAERAPGKFILGFAPDPRRPEAIDQLQAAMAIYGVRICGELKLRMMYDNPDALRLFRFCGKQGMPVTIHIDYPGNLDEHSKYPRPDYWYGGGIEALERVLQACPDTIVLGHAPGFWSHISADEHCRKPGYPTGKIVPGGQLIRMLKTYPNLYCDWSAGSGHNALSRDPEFGRAFFLEFQDRILYARDDFDNKHQDFLNSLNLPATVLAKIYSGNALKLVPLPDQG
ncbi:MAG: amidohydrolase [Verrucomicrobia bacterium]|nr:amidohydrolase [Verrucomicrobiota bacterium]MBU4292185.1 amidohydrolase [Verrucomicrobiota bacterium]MBU4428759.1 amidohydrolase [Verrucomicrobiota bacterium]MCG2681629.1 amidohydrolase [Kiritimatiellia bacterium]